MTSDHQNRLCLVTVNYNYAPYLEDCMASIINQRGFDRVDYVVMDAGSTDGSVEIIESHQEKLQHWQSEPDDGMYHGVEAGFAKSDAEIMGWLNSDDMLAPWAIQTALDIFDQLPEVQWITSRYPMQARKDGLVMKADFMPGVDQWGFYNGEHIKSSGLPTSGWIVQDSTFWRRSLWDEAGGTFDHTLSLACDFELWARFIEKADCHVVPVPLGIYRFQGDNKAVVSRDEYRDECVKVLQRYTPIIPEDADRLGERVFAKHLGAFGFGHLVDPARMPKYKSVVFSHGDERYHVVDV
ncbi:MAG: glycosyltransferase [Rhodospirillaceae bacterium]|nr:glycosyltransferase [Rhodospirillaceae bacterium]MBT5564600.1 glycosyltransferase [Rhodospirillaceae bacterium]MBT6090935.1 glycosyltransferase [Rhodospirillaceae bacterium]MBT6960160.1 glycosyltransferase [Rhodospirillaceae bacterium]MBT7449960.1 glycosyltransferase [Rhodospirillaceae bacterium]